MSKIIHKSCSPLCPVCRQCVIGEYVLDDEESACYWDNFHITPGVLSFVNNGYSHNILKNKKNTESVKSTLNLLEDNVYAEYMFDLLEDIDILPGTI